MDPRRLQTLIGHLDAYIQEIENFTVPMGAVRKIVNIPAVSTLSMSFERLAIAVSETRTAGVVAPTKEEPVRVSSSGRHGDPLMTALSILEQVIAWPRDRRGDGDRQRFRFHDGIPESDLVQLRGARNALARAIPAQDAPDGRPIAAAVDFTWLRVGDDRYEFSKGQQAGVIRILYAAWKRAGADGYGESESTLADELEGGTGFRVVKTFSGHPALHTILRRPAKGIWALFLYESRKEDSSEDS